MSTVRCCEKLRTNALNEKKVYKIGDNAILRNRKKTKRLFPLILV